MKPVNALAHTIGPLLAADTAVLASVTAMKVGLIVAPYVGSIDRLIGDLTLSAATGLVPLAGVAGAQLESIDPITGESVVEIKAPAGGFRWETPGGFTGPVTVYGFALCNGAVDALYGTEALDPPQILTTENQSITAPELSFKIDTSKIT